MEEMVGYERKKSRSKIVAVYLHPESMHELVNESYSFVDSPEWSKITHVIYQGLSINSLDGTVYVHGMTSTATMLKTAARYIPMLQQLKRKYPSIKIYWGFSPGQKYRELMEQVLDKERCPRFWSSLERVLFRAHADGCELNFENVTYYTSTFMADLALFAYCSNTFVVLCNRTRWRNDGNESFLNELQLLVDKIVVNSYGYVEYCGQSVDTQPPGVMLRTMESALHHYELTWKNELEGLLPAHKLLMGIETSGLMFKCDGKTDNKLDLKIISLAHIQRAYQYGIEFEKGEQIHKLDRLYNDWIHGSALKSKAGDVHNVYISYDNHRVRELKLNMVRNVGMAGVVLGDFKHDLNVMNPKSLLAMANRILIQEASGDDDAEPTVQFSKVSLFDDLTSEPDTVFKIDV